LTVSVPAQPIVLEADPVYLTQVVTNLLNNAAKYTPQGGRLEVQASKDGSDALVQVRDTGIGIPDDRLDSIFNIFERLEGVESTPGGLGIGLSLARSLVEMHDGRIRVSSDGPGRGSVFTVSLPLGTPGSDATADPLPGSDAQAKLVRVLVVDDNQDAAEALSMLVEALGVEVRTALNGTTALTLVREFRPDVVFLDIGMPDMSGYEVAKRLRSDPDNRRTALVAITGWSQDSDRKRAMEAGFDHHIAKPIDLNEIKRLIGGAGPITMPKG
jgi:CheY-like chemotaxis protein/anti-sigma regulatory factor (Ser/Thr protein kinase)